MNFTLQRTVCGLYGTFGTLTSDDSRYKFYTLEHAYPVIGPKAGSEFVPKVAPGVYVCKRGTHQLAPTDRHPHPSPFETFELQNVPPFQGAEVTKILLHVGNYNHDSNGCILLGSQQQAGALIDSQDAFNHFMESQSGIDEFTLTIL